VIGNLKIGFIVNPIAGMGGKVGLKGTDEVSKKAAAMGAEPIAPERAVEFLKKLSQLHIKPPIKILTYPCAMGEAEVKSAGLSAEVLEMHLKSETTAEDTKLAVKLMLTSKVDLIVFVGGDGTARDILDAMKGLSETPVLGVPSGVKMYSGIFAVNPLDAAEVVEAFAKETTEIMDFEVIDVDEAAVRSDHFSMRLYGLLKGPFIPMRIQGSKQISPETADEYENQTAIARFVIEEMNPKGTYILGPGTTIKRLADLLGVEKTLLGIDIYKDGTVMKDVNEEKILQEIQGWQNTWIILSPIGRQGVLLGRGNQQISPEIIRRVGKEKIIVGATKSKIRSIEGGTLRVDTGDLKVDALLRGYIKVATDYREWRVMRVQ
jgi:predicted polyphosphate/ATP-dependent NAD kinase